MSVLTRAAATVYRGQLVLRQRLAAARIALRAAGSACSGDPQRVLVVVAGLLGDSVMTIPLVVEAKRLWPNASITVLGKRSNCELFSRVSEADECIVAVATPFRLRDMRGGRVLRDWIASKRFDVAIVALGNDFAVPIAAAGVPVRVGFAATPTARCLTHARDFRSPREWGPAEQVSALTALGYDCTVREPQLAATEDDVARAGKLLADTGLTTPGRLVLVHPFGRTARQRWPIERVLEFADGVVARGMEVAIIGGSEHANSVAADDRIRDLVGRLDLGELLGVMVLAKAVVSTDSGPFHLGGALSVPTIGLFRATRPEHARRYRSAYPVFGSHPACQRKCVWDRCTAVPCLSMASIGGSDVLAVLDSEVLGCVAHD